MIRVLIASDIRLYREGLEAVLARDGRVQVQGTVSSTDQALVTLERETSDVVLVDMAMPRAMALVQSVYASEDDAKVVALGVSEVSAEVLACAEAGISGYVCRDATLEDLVATVKRASADELRCSDRVAGALVRHVARLSRRQHKGGAPQHDLTPRERQIVHLLDEGRTNKEIGAQLHIAEATVKNHVHNILEKLEVRTRGQAASKARSLLPRRRSRPGRVP